MPRSLLSQRPGEWPLPPDPGESRLLLDLFPDPLIVARGPRRKVIAINRACQSLLACSETEDVRDRELTAFFHEDDQHRLLSFGGDGDDDPTPVLMKIQHGEDWRPVAVMGGRRVSPSGEERWVYRLRVLEESGVGLEREMEQQRKRASEAVRTSLRIFHLTEKIRTAPRLSTLLIGVRDEVDFFARAGTLLCSEGLGYRNVRIWSYSCGEKKLAWSSQSSDCDESSLKMDMEVEDDRGRRRLPLVVGEGTPGGLLELSIDPRELKLLEEAPLLMEWHEEVLGTIGEILALTLQNLRLHDQLEKQALLDPLTGIANRLYLGSQLEKEVSRAAREGGDLGLLFADLDGFKKVNDVLGHMVGDELLQEVSTLLVNFFRESDHVCRYGGDEFVVLLPGSNLQDMELKGRELLERFRKQRFLEGRAREVSDLSLSVGVTAARNGVSGEALLDEADAALYRAKRSGRDRLVVVKPDQP
ncbi:MAG: GGDEF domain-containing protein [Planctomycetota bacterium]